MPLLIIFIILVILGIIYYAINRALDKADEANKEKHLKENEKIRQPECYREHYHEKQQITGDHFFKDPKVWSYEYTTQKTIWFCGHRMSSDVCASCSRHKENITNDNEECCYYYTPSSKCCELDGYFKDFRG